MLLGATLKWLEIASCLMRKGGRCRGGRLLFKCGKKRRGEVRVRVLAEGLTQGEGGGDFFLF